MDSTRGGLIKPEDGEAADIDILNANFDRIADYAMGYYICTSTSRPAQPWSGLRIYETDTRRRFFWDEVINDWFKEGGPVSVVSQGRSLSSGSIGASSGVYVTAVNILGNAPYAGMMRIQVNASFHSTANTSGLWHVGLDSVAIPGQSNQVFNNSGVAGIMPGGHFDIEVPTTKRNGVNVSIHVTVNPGGQAITLNPAGTFILVTV